MATIWDPMGKGSNPNLNDLVVKQKGFFVEWYDPGTDDEIFALGGNDVVTIHNGNDRVWGGYGDDVIVDRGGGNDFINGEDGNDTFVAGTGENLFHGGSGQDAVSYEASPVGAIVDLVHWQGYASGIDTLYSVENVHGSPYADALRGDHEANYLNGHGGYDTLEGWGGDDFLEGGTGTDTLDGNHDSDTLYGGLDRDILIGGHGADRFLYVAASDSVWNPYVPGNGRDVIVDFHRGEDTIDLSAIDARTDLKGNNTFSFVGSGFAIPTLPGTIEYYHAGGDTYVQVFIDSDLLDDMSIIIAGEHNLTALDFIL